MYICSKYYLSICYEAIVIHISKAKQYSLLIPKNNMAIVKGPFELNGSMSNVTFYTRRGSDKVIMRTKGGVSGDKIKRQPKYEGFRNQQKEWSGATKLAAGVRMAFGNLQRLADYNLSSALNGLANKIQKSNDTENKGTRPVCLSQYRQTLDGFNFNRTYLFNSALRTSVNFELDRTSLQAAVIFPRINTQVDLFNLQGLPFFRLIVALGTASDMVFDENLGDYLPAVAMLHGASAVFNNPRVPANSIVEEQTLSIQMTDKQIAALTNEVSVILSVAIEFGAVSFTGQPEAVKYAGSGKVLGCR